MGDAIHIAERTELPLQISHRKAAGSDNCYKIPMVLDLIERARDRGLEVTADRCPYTVFATSLSIIGFGMSEKNTARILKPPLVSRGFYADIVIFDPHTVIDRATDPEPAQ